MIITIDGPAGSGKSTVADIIANQLGFVHFNSGSLFRAITAHLYSQNFDIENITTNSEIPNFDLQVRIIDDVQHVFVDGIDYTPVLRDNHISTLVANVALNKFCRQKTSECQHNFCLKNNVVMEGRDIGSHVFPNAEYKFYLDCSIEERARRRFKEEQAKHTNITLEEIMEQIAERDYLDKNREIAPLVVPENAIVIYSTNLSIEEVVDEITSHINTHQI